MESYAITVTGLKKVFKVPKKKHPGLLASVKSLFDREFSYINAVDGIDLKIAEGEIRGLIGPNGAGKSTTIKILSGVLYPSEGSVDVMGYTPWLQRHKYVKQIGVVLGQKTQLWWDLPAIDTFRLHKVMYSIDEKNFNENIAYFSEVLNIGDVINRPVRQLSLGERMKCELVCALLHEPKLIYLDEPTIGLDLLSKEAVRTFIKKVNQDKKTTFILTTHDLEDIENLCGNVTIINKGKVAYDDSIGNLRTFFSNKKLIEVKFAKAVAKDELSHYNVRMLSPFAAKMEIDINERSLQTEVYNIFNTLPVHDINISSIDIEEVIKKVYAE